MKRVCMHGVQRTRAGNPQCGENICIEEWNKVLEAANSGYNPDIFFGFERPAGSENDPFWWMSLFAEPEKPDDVN